jgi:hypothetical protein
MTRCQILGRLICHPLAFKKPSKIKGRKVPLKKARVFRAPLSSAGGRSPRTGAQGSTRPPKFAGISRGLAKHRERFGNPRAWMGSEQNRARRNSLLVMWDQGQVEARIVERRWNLRDLIRVNVRARLPPARNGVRETWKTLGFPRSAFQPPILLGFLNAIPDIFGGASVWWLAVVFVWAPRSVGGSLARPGTVPRIGPRCRLFDPQFCWVS